MSRHSQIRLAAFQISEPVAQAVIPGAVLDGAENILEAENTLETALDLRQSLLHRGRGAKGILLEFGRLRTEGAEELVHQAGVSGRSFKAARTRVSMLMVREFVETPLPRRVALPSRS